MAKKKQAKSKKSALAQIPTKAEILAFIEAGDGKIGKREIARAFHIKGADRIRLKKILREMADDGLLTGSRKKISQPGKLPSVTLIDIQGRDDMGDFYGRPVKWESERDGPPPKVLLDSHDDKSDRIGLGDRILAHIDKIVEPDDYPYSCRVIKKIRRDNRRMLGVFEVNTATVNHQPPSGGWIQPIDRKWLKSWQVDKSEQKNAKDGELVVFELMGRPRYGPPRARILESLGNPTEAGHISLIAVHSYGLPDQFPLHVLQELETLPSLTLNLGNNKEREDLCHIPFITIDPEDARDHDDAVWAAKDERPVNPDGWVVMVAIADVAHYVRPGTALDKQALLRGNSAYFPDRVVPMLPEKISNDLCSLREGERRPALVVEMVFDKRGDKISHHFRRAMIRSAAKLAYGQAQSAIDGEPDDKTGPLLTPILKPLWGAYDAVKKARDKRQPLALDLPERKIIMGRDVKGKATIERIYVPERLEAHKLIEEFMIQANVSAAETLEKKNIPFIFRVHDAPSDEKLKNLRDFLNTLEINIAASGPLKPKQFNQLLAQVKESAYDELVSTVVLRAQAQAEYNPQNLGHFGLNLRRYAHFTSPIRRYADLMVHRALISSLGLGEDGLREEDLEHLSEIAEEISDHERRAMKAERETIDRLIASHLASEIGATFEGRIAGVTRSGLFVQLRETGADGFIPASTIGREFYVHDEKHNALIGEESGETYQLGQNVEVRLVEAIPTAGALRFEMLSEGLKGKSGRRQRGKKTGQKHSPKRRKRHKRRK